MKNENYFEIMDNIDENFILDAAPVHKTKKQVPLKLILSAAVVAIVGLSLTLGASNMGNTNVPTINDADTSSATEAVTKPESLTDNDPSFILEDKVTESQPDVTEPIPDYVNGLPVLNPELSVSGYGFEGMLVYDISELDKNDPFDPEKKLDTLPVYKNLSYDPYTAGIGLLNNFTRDELKAMVDNAALELGAEITSYQCEGNILFYDKYGGVVYKDFSSTEETYENEIIIKYVGVTDQFTITAFHNGNINFTFNENNMLPLPDHLIPSRTKVTQEEKRLIVDYIVSTYSEYFSCDKLTGGDIIDYTFSGEYYDIHNKWLDNYYHNLSDDYVQSILNFNFSQYHFGLNEELSHVVSITVPGDYTAYTEKLGDYPVITYKDALDRLCEGKYLSTVSEEYLTNGIITEDIVHHTEIVYLTAPGNKVFMPYYKYYVLLGLKHEKSPEDLKNYGVFYVPAVSSEYIKADSVVINGQWGMSNENT